MQLAAAVACALVTALTLACGSGTPGGPSPQPPPPPAAAPTVTSISPSGGPTDGGVAVVVTGTGFVSGARVALGDTAATGVTVTSATSITATIPSRSAGVVDVVVTNPDGQSGRLAGGFTYNAPVVPPPSISGITPTSGPTTGFTVVTITGAGFAQGAMVTFGDTAATGVTVTSATNSTATTAPRGAGRVDLILTNPDGQSGRLADAFTYVAPAPPPPSPQPVAPTVTAISPTSGSTAGGTTVAVTGTGFASGATVTFGTSAASNVSVASATSITGTTPPRAAGAVDVVVTNPDGLSGRLTAGFTFVTPPPPPTPVITITAAGVSPSNLTITLGMRVRFVNNDTVSRSINSDPHPAHTQCPEINQVSFLAPGQSRETGAFAIRNTCGFHDHNDPFNANVQGTIVIR